MDISVIIPSYNSERYLADTLTSVAKQRTDFTFEIIVVDCSTSQQAAEIARRFELVTLRQERTRFNPGGGRNIGASIATGKLLLFIDSDVVLAPTALQEAYSFFKKGHVIFGGALELNEGTKPRNASYLEHYFFNHESHQSRVIFSRSNLSSALLAIDRDLFIEHKGFSDLPRIQDTEFTERLTNAGLKLMFTPAVVGYQTQDSSLTSVIRKIFITGKNLFYIRYKNTSTLKKLSIFLLLPLISAAKIARILYRHMHYQTRSQKLKTLVISPLIAFGGISWMAGMYHALIVDSGIDEARE